MPTNSEIRSQQTAILYKLLLANKEVKQKGVKIEKLEEFIRETRSTMTKEDIAWVEQEINEETEI